MNGQQLKALLQEIPEFGGVYCLDNLPSMPRYRPLSIIINTDPCSMPGEHWLALHLDIYGKGEYFDSFGLPPLHSEIRTFLSQNSPNGWTWSHTTYQSIDANTCGHYCALFIKMKHTNKDISDVLTQSASINDSWVRRLLKIY